MTGERRPPSDRALTDAWLSEKIKSIHEAKRRVMRAEDPCRASYGSRYPRRQKAR